MLRHLFAGILYSISFVLLCTNAAIYLIGEYTLGAYFADWWWLLLLMVAGVAGAMYLSSEYARPRPKPSKKPNFKHWPRRL
jgi:hypothetical protein